MLDWGEGRVQTNLKTCGRGIDVFLEQGYIWPCFYFDSLMNIGAKLVKSGISVFLRVLPKKLSGRTFIIS